MTDSDLIKIIRKSIILDNLQSYKDIFENTDLNSVTDDYWRESLGLYRQLNESNRSILFDIIRQIQVDTIFNLLGLIDGVNMFEGQENDFELKYSSHTLSGDLQSLFLEEEENN